MEASTVSRVRLQVSFLLLFYLTQALLYQAEDDIPGDDARNDLVPFKGKLPGGVPDAVEDDRDHECLQKSRIK